MTRAPERGRPRPFGQAMVEFALVLPVFLTLVLAFVDFGLGVYVYNTLQQATKESVRRGMVISNDCAAYLKSGNTAGTYSGVDSSQTYLTYTTTASDSSFCTGFVGSAGATSRSTIVGTVANVAGIMNRSAITVVIGGTAPGRALPPPGTTITVTTSYRHQPIFGNIFTFDLTLTATGTGLVQ